MKDRSFEEIRKLIEQKSYNLKDNSSKGIKKYFNLLKKMYYEVKDKWLNKTFEGKELKHRSQVYVLSIIDLFNNLEEFENNENLLQEKIESFFEKNLESIMKQEQYKKGKS